MICAKDVNPQLTESGFGMKIASFNINGIKARLPALLDWLRQSQPDIAILQEIKSTDENFPCEEIEALGYAVHTHGQKSFNGVAILTKPILEDIKRGLEGDEEDTQARYIEASVMGEKNHLRLCGLYLPNGNPIPGPKFDYKIAWMTRLEARIRALLKQEEPFALLGDFNVIPQAEDCWDAQKWEEDALFHPKTREAYRRIVNLGLTDAFRACHPAQQSFSFWDYQAGAWQKNHGIRIDHALLSPQAADLLINCEIEQDVRAGEKPSDHVPISIEMNI